MESVGRTRADDNEDQADRCREDADDQLDQDQAIEPRLGIDVADERHHGENGCGADDDGSDRRENDMCSRHVGPFGEGAAFDKMECVGHQKSGQPDRQWIVSARMGSCQLR